MYFAHIDRMSRSLLTLNRDREYVTLRRMLAFSTTDTVLPENSPLSFRARHQRRHFVTQYFRQDTLLGMMQTVGLRCEPERTVHLFRSRLASHLRQRFIRHPRFWLPLFPLLYSAVRL